MKTTKLIIIATLAILVTTSFGPMSPSLKAAHVEEEMFMEPWMTVPFENTVTEDAMFMESWMTAPFVEIMNEDKTELEAWMTIPFEGPAGEEVFCLEAWMTTPFEVAGMDKWMIAATRR